MVKLKERLTDKIAAGLEVPKGSSPADFVDSELSGFACRVMPSGGRSWYVFYRTRAGQKRGMSLGPTGRLRAVQARQEARRILGEVAAGRDPKAELDAARAAAKAPAPEPPMSLGQLIERFLADPGHRWNPKTRTEAERYLRKHWLPLHDMPVGEVTPQAVGGQLSVLTAKGARTARNRARAALSACFSWAMSEGLAEANPVAPSRNLEEKARERVLSVRELQLVWSAVEGQGDYADIIRLLILTGQRRAEIGDMAWSELDLANAEWTLPSERSKNGLSLVVPLAPAALGIIQNRQPLADKDNLFGRETRRSRGFQGWSKAKSALDAKLAPHGIKPWTVHDIRRSVVTGLSRMETPPHIVEAIVNHQSGFKGGVAGTYNRWDYLDERRSALGKWAETVVPDPADACDQRLGFAG
jgi:integrase